MMEARRRRRLLQRSLLLGVPEEDTEEYYAWIANQQASPLLRLPPELRNRIYELLLAPGIIVVHHQPVASKTGNIIIPGGFHCCLLAGNQNPIRETRNRSTGREERGMTLLAGVCRQLYRETALLPFQLNAWCFESQRVLERYVLKEKRLAREQRRALKTLYVGGKSARTMAHKCFNDLDAVIWY